MAKVDIPSLRGSPGAKWESQALRGVVQGVPGVKGLTKGLLVGQGGRLGGPRGPRKIPRYLGGPIWSQGTSTNIGSQGDV